MTISNKTAISLTLIGLFVAATPSNAATVAESGLENEVNQCLSEVRQHLNYNDAIGVRHVVKAIERRTVGYTMKIDTAVVGEFGNETIRAYATTCVVNGNNKPLKFAISETS
jgi:hypothetical protein